MDMCKVLQFQGEERAGRVQGLFKGSAQANVVSPRRRRKPKFAHWRAAPARTHNTGAHALERVVLPLRPRRRPASAQQNLVASEQRVALLEGLLSLSTGAVAVR